jgi:hypothetical protein
VAHSFFIAGIHSDTDNSFGFPPSSQNEEKDDHEIHERHENGRTKSVFNLWFFRGHNLPVETEPFAICLVSRQTVGSESNAG